MTGGWTWTSDQPKCRRSPAPLPLGTERGRLLQMGELAPIPGTIETVRGRCRCVGFQSRPPLQRPDAGIQDGDLQPRDGDQPDVYHHRVAKVAGSGTPVWQYGLARQGGAALSVSLDGKEVWTQPIVTIPHADATYTNRFLPRLKDSQ